MNSSSQNPYACIEGGEEDEDEGGDVIYNDTLQADLNEPLPNNNSSDDNQMTGLRLLIRICTSSGELWNFLGIGFAQRRQWTEGLEEISTGATL